jgi:ATP-dependent Clp protease protease subunit
MEKEIQFDSEWVNAYFDKGIDVINRRIFLGDIDEESIDHCIKGLYLMQTNDDKKPVELFISSYGGTIYDALALYDIMGTLSCPVHTFAYGKCMSAAPLLLAAGEPGFRWVAQHTFFMHHDGADEMEGKTTKLIADMKQMVQVDKAWTDLIVKLSNKTSKWWNDRAKRSEDFYFSADEAIQWGLADSIWSER